MAHLFAPFACFHIPILCRFQLFAQVVGSSGGSVFIDTEIGLHLLGYHITDVGCCKILRHDLWLNNAYPSTFFSLAPLDVTLSVLNKAKQNQS